ncbi:MAG: hypothetical protein M3157_00590 [Actinomycetota bacterium]|nr:hypothetical protein [Actinomycetota bacterium]
MPELSCTARRTGDYESRTEEYELSYAVDGAASRTIAVRYQAARAYEINAALDAAVEAVRESIAEAAPGLEDRPSDGTLSQFTWRAIQSVKYEEGAEKTSSMDL